MGEALDRPWISDFDREYYHWRDNRETYSGITPDHGNDSWKVSTTSRGRRFAKAFRSLTEAQEAVNTFRQSAGEV